IITTRSEPLPPFWRTLSVLRDSSDAVGFLAALLPDHRVDLSSAGETFDLVERSGAQSVRPETRCFRFDGDRERALPLLMRLDSGPGGKREAGRHGTARRDRRAESILDGRGSFARCAAASGRIPGSIPRSLRHVGSNEPER